MGKEHGHDVTFWIAVTFGAVVQPAAEATRAMSVFVTVVTDFILSSSYTKTELQHAVDMHLPELSYIAYILEHVHC